MIRAHKWILSSFTLELLSEHQFSPLSYHSLPSIDARVFSSAAFVSYYRWPYVYLIISPLLCKKHQETFFPCFGLISSFLL